MAQNAAPPNPRIAIIGAGIGGLTLAIELRRQGLDAEIYDQAEELREVGAAVGLAANSVRYLQSRTGIGEELAAHAADITALIFRDGRDGRHLGTPLEQTGYLNRSGAPFYGIHRAQLQRILIGALGNEGLHLGHQLVDIDDTGSAARLSFANGATAKADLVIGADGVRSIMRRHVVGYDDAQFSGCAGWRGIVPQAALDDLPDPGALQFWIGPDGHLLHYPIGNGDQNFLLVRRHTPWASDRWVVPSEHDEHLRAFEGWHSNVTHMISQVPVTEKWALFERPPLHHWSRGRITLIGDAAHAMVPHHGQGANQSIEDAMVLADCLMRSAADGSGWDEGRAEYERLRIPRTRKVQIASHTTADVLHLPDGPRAEQRNARLAAPDAWERHLSWVHEFIADEQYA